MDRTGKLHQDICCKRQAGHNIFAFSVVYGAFTIVTMLIINVVAFAIALLLTKGLKGTNLFRTVFFLPNLIGGIVLSYIWLMIFNVLLVPVQHDDHVNTMDGILGTCHRCFMAANRLHDDHLHCGVSRIFRVISSRLQNRRSIGMADVKKRHDPNADPYHCGMYIPYTDKRI